MVKPFRADLHCHSTCSDGELTPKELIDLAVSSGLKGLSITDHDTIDAYGEAILLAKEAGIQLLPGVELSTLENGHSVHILAYGFDLKSPVIRELCEEQMRRRQGRVQRILESLSDLGMEVSVEITGSVGRPHVASAMVKAGFVQSVPEAFRKYLSEGKSAFVPTDAVSSAEAIDTIHQAGALAVLAHPVLIKRNRLLRNLLERPFDGLEAYYARVPAAEKERFVKIALSQGWLATGGSDFHGPSTRYGTLGTSWTPKETFDILYTHYLKVCS
jgi:predicted metal-dependent phosphoesterase TrpH